MALKYDFPVGGLVENYHETIGNAFIDYVDEVLTPAMEKANNPKMLVDHDTS